MNSKGRQFHGQAAEARERGDFLEALQLTDQALLAYQEENDNAGFAELQAERFLTLRHLFEKTEDKQYLILAKHSAMAGVELADHSGQPEAAVIPLYNLAKAQETLGELDQAVQTYQKAVEGMQNNPPESHNRPAILADMKVHLTTCEYKAGDKSALERAEQALEELEKAEEISDYNKHVWLSGGHMRLAEILASDDKQKSQEHLQKAKEIIDNDERLTLRQGQWQKLSSKIQ